ncbi:spore maturation protein [Rubeoparvulum massiliense]|uniref:spore maturation protein n=1 Tax=Rubeoparvulum massiliense TaxID=1631346 RepID=UPI00065E0541|nr:nucleoside recognition domain-containing protein [Rubeoparvulum massiliense]
MNQVMNLLSQWSIPLLLSTILLLGYWKKVPLFSTFIEGAGEGFRMAVQIMPPLVGMLVAIQIFRASGAMDLILMPFVPLLQFFQVPPDVLPLAILRPLSGSGSLAMMTDLIAQHGPDSLIGRMASVIQGSTDTTLYILTVYFGAVGVRHVRYALQVGLIADLAGFLAAITITMLMFG